jgi:hypothetical protein
MESRHASALVDFNTESTLISTNSLLINVSPRDSLNEMNKTVVIGVSFTLVYIRSEIVIQLHYSIFTIKATL